MKGDKMNISITQNELDILWHIVQEEQNKMISAPEDNDIDRYVEDLEALLIKLEKANPDFEHSRFKH
jgi:hypothetical protein